MQDIASQRLSEKTVHPQIETLGEIADKRAFIIANPLLILQTKVN
jgi:hypothetical protein